MNSIIFGSLFFIWFIYCPTAFATQEPIISNNVDKSINKHSVINSFNIEQGIANFTQEKHFSFLSTPIKSTGVLKIKGNSIIWQVNTPVFSKLLIQDNQVWEQTTPSNQEGHKPTYQKVATHESIETLIQTVFTGKIDSNEWKTSTTNSQCIVLMPINSLLTQAISQLELCHGDANSKRVITIKDKQNNATKIMLNQTTTILSDEDVKEFNIYP